MIAGRARALGLLLPVLALLWLVSPVARAGGVDLPATGQVSCWDQSGTVVPCAGTGDDGEIQMGVAWPTPRFTDLGNCIRDRLTGLTWAANADILDDTPRWEDALAWADDLTLCDAEDWRIPNAVEMRSLVHAEGGTIAYLEAQGFTNVAEDYWTSTTHPGSPGAAVFVKLLTGAGSSMPKQSHTQAHAWPVRGQTSPPAKTWQTRQLTCYDEDGLEIDCVDTGQDGEYRAGVAWPAPRFTVHGDGTVTDDLTGLVWAEDALAPGPPACAPGTQKTWIPAHEYVECLNERDWLGYADWSIPNLTQLMSLIDYESSEPALPAGHPFQNVQLGDRYWTSTTTADLPTFSWVVDMNDASVVIGSKSGTRYNVWPVRTYVPEPGLALQQAVAAGLLLLAALLRRLIAKSLPHRLGRPQTGRDERWGRGPPMPTEMGASRALR